MFSMWQDRTLKNKILTPEYEKQLAQAYYNCLKLAHDNDLKSLAFCCISTGEFGFPNERAAIRSQVRRSKIFCVKLTLSSRSFLMFLKTEI